MNLISHIKVAKNKSLRVYHEALLTLLLLSLKFLLLALLDNVVGHSPTICTGLELASQ